MKDISGPCPYGVYNLEDIQLLLDWLYEGYFDLVKRKNTDESHALKKIEKIFWEATKSMPREELARALSKWNKGCEFKFDEQIIAYLNLRLNEEAGLALC